MPVRDIATECGYYDISAFNRRFKSYTGFTPQQFRRQSEEGTLPPDYMAALGDYSDEYDEYEYEEGYEPAEEEADA